MLRRQLGDREVQLQRLRSSQGTGSVAGSGSAGGAGAAGTPWLRSSLAALPHRAGSSSSAAASRLP